MNKGLANSVIFGVTKILEKYEAVIVLEDDLVPSLDFLKYMNKSLEKYQNSEKVGSISAFGFKVYPINRFSNYFHRRPNTWGWGTWASRWQTINWDITEDKEIYDPGFRRKFNRGGEDLYRMLKGYLRGDIDSWGIRWAFFHYKNGWVASCPVNSRITNNGYDDNGTNCNKNSLIPSITLSKLSSIRLSCDIRENFFYNRQVNWHNSNIKKIIFKALNILSRLSRLGHN
jgi:hypothetical protein